VDRELLHRDPWMVHVNYTNPFLASLGKELLLTIFDGKRKMLNISLSNVTVKSRTTLLQILTRYLC